MKKLSLMLVAMGIISSALFAQTEPKAADKKEAKHEKAHHAKKAEGTAKGEKKEAKPATAEQKKK